MKNVLVITTVSSVKALESSYVPQEGYKVIYRSLGVPLKIGVSVFVRQIIDEVAEGKLQIDGVVGLTDTASLIASNIAQKLSLPFSPISGLMSCQNKFISRLRQTENVPEFTPRFGLVRRDIVDSLLSSSRNRDSFLKDTNLKYPIITKPVRGSLSRHVYICHSDDDFKQALSSWGKVKDRNMFYKSILDEIGVDADFQKSIDEYLLEEFIEADVQVTVDGFVSEKCSFFGSTHSIFVPGTLSFDRFEFPYKYNYKGLENKVYRVCRDVVRSVGLTNSLFNVEIRMNVQTGDIYIVEINSRPSTQFMYLIKSVTGNHPLTAGLSLAVGENPEITKEKDKGVAVCFVLRENTDLYVKNIPSSESIMVLMSKYPGVKYSSFIKPGKKLSDYPQDMYTYRLAQVKLLGSSFDKVRKDFEKVNEELDYEFENVDVR